MNKQVNDGSINFKKPRPKLDTYPASGGNDGWLMAYLLGQFGVGELSPRHGEGWTLSIHDNHILWSERQCVVAAKHWSLQRKVGGGHR